MSADSFKQLIRHLGHDISVRYHGVAGGEKVNVAVECDTCHEILLDFDNEEEIRPVLVNAKDCYEDDNDGFIYGIEWTQGENVIDCEWFKTEEKRQSVINK